MDIFDNEYPQFIGKAVLGLKGQEKNKKVPKNVIPVELQKGIKDISKNPYFEYQLASSNHTMDEPDEQEL